MEIRRVQFTGGSSYVLTLPKEWVDARKIKKNDPLGIEVQPDGTLTITTATAREPVQRVKEFAVTESIEPDYLFRLLIGAYIAGFTTIVIRSGDRLPPFVRTVVRNFTQMTIGQEVIEETEQAITLKDLLSPAEMPFANSIRRMYVIVRAMHEDAVAAIRTRNTDLAKDVAARDNDVDRLHWLIARQTSMVLSHTELSKRMGITPVMANHYLLISRIIERIGDHAERIADNVPGVLAREIDAATMEKIAQASRTALALFDRSIVAFFDGDMKKAQKTIGSLQALEALCDGITGPVSRQEAPGALALGNIMGSIRRVGEYSADIAENVINYLVENEQPHKKKAGR